MTAPRRLRRSTSHATAARSLTTVLVTALMVGLLPSNGAVGVTTAPTDPPSDGPSDAPSENLGVGLAEGELPSLPPNVGGWPAVPAATAASLLVLDKESGTVLAARDPDRLRAVASTVKMLTAVTARRLEQDMTRVVVAGPEVRGLEGSGVGLGEGEGWTVQQLLEAMLVRSGNDAAEALGAQLVPGGTERFLEEMRSDAARMGLDNAVIVSPSGLDDDNQLSAAHLATIAVALLDDPVLAEIVALDATRLPGLGAVPNRNELVRRDPTVIGVKTGFTDAAGHSLVAAAERDGRITIAVVLDAATPDARFEDAERLLDHAALFASLPSLEPVGLGCPGRTVHLQPEATSVVVPLEDVDLVSVPWPPLRCPITDELIVTPTLQRLPLVPVRVDVTIEQVASSPSPDAELGRWVAGLVQDAMRAVPPSTMVGAQR